MTRKEFYTKTYQHLCILIAFFLPVYIHIVPILIGLLLINWIVEGNFSEKYLRIRKNKIALLFIGFYILYLIGMLWTKNTSSGWFDLEIKLSLLLFPLIFASSNSIRANNLKTILKVFVFGCFSTGIICYMIAIVYYIQTGENHFAYTDFSYVLHPSYLAMYLLLAIAIILVTLEKSIGIKLLIVNSFLILFLMSVVILLAAKFGTILMLLLIIAYPVYFSIKRKKILFPILFLSLAFIIVWTIFHYSPYTKGRIDTAIDLFSGTTKIDTANMESNSERILIWKSDLVAIKKNILTGTGTGDAKDELISTYKQLDYKYLLDHKFNAHNQFFQTTIALGVSGSILLFLNLIIPLWVSVKKRQTLLFIFIILLSLNFLVESMLEVQAGVMFYAFFNSILIFENNEY